MEEKKYRYSVTDRPFNQKLPQEKFGKVNKSIISTESTITEFAEKISKPNAHSWSGGQYSNKIIDNKNWLGSEIIGLDFDTGEQTVEEIYKIFNDNGISPNLIYNTFGNTSQKHKFRVVLFFDNPIVDEKIYNKIMNKLESLFLIDKKCKNCSRIFYGGTDIKITSHSPINLGRFIDFINLIITSTDNGLTRSIIPFRMDDADLRSSIYYNNTDYTFLAVVDDDDNNNEEQSSTFIPTSLKGGQRIKWELASERIKIWDEFLKGKWLHQDELFGLATNLIYISGGLKKMKETMEHYDSIGVTHYTDNNYAVMPYVKHKKYYPVPIHKFSKYIEDADSNDFISEVTNIRGNITILKAKEKISLPMAEKQFIKKFNESISGKNFNKTTLILVPTALGKTELLTNVKKIACSLPTNDLKNEVRERMKVEHTFTPDTVKFSDKFLQKRIDNFYKVGLPKKAMELIHSTAENKSGYSMEDVSIAAKYLGDLATCDDVNLSQLTTHKRLLNLDKVLHPTIIFDEDPLNTLVEIQTTKITELSKLYCMYQPIAEVIDYLNALVDGSYELPTFKLDISKLIKHCSDLRDIESNVFDFFNCKHFLLEKGIIHYIIKKVLPENKNIILSATLSPYIYKKLYPNIEFDIFNISNVVQKGQVIQYTGRSCSRSSLNRYGDQISKEIGDKKVITFKKYGGIFTNADEQAYFGNCSGYDHLNGQDIVVVGTPHRAMAQYFLLAKLMGVDFDVKSSPMNYQKIQYNDFEFMFNCFDNEELRTIQLSLIESDLIQAVGRARTLRNDNVVEVYSNFPLDITTKFHIKKPKQ